MNSKDIQFHPLTPERWPDFEKLFGPNGACAGCWCMWWRLTSAQFRQMRGEANRQALQAIVESGGVPGIVAYSDGQPAGWCAIAPRHSLPRLKEGKSRIFAPVDHRPVWSVTCFFIARPFRRQGLSVKLLEAAVHHAAGHGATIIEGYPVEPTGPALSPVEAYTGLADTFRRVGFVEVARRSETRPIMRYFVAGQGGGPASRAQSEQP
jgi:GNAT superfamily N-acetyltransferase